MLKLFGAVMQALTIITALVQIVERDGDGKQKHEEVVGFFMDKGAGFVDLPQWAAKLFLNVRFVGWLVDVVVWAANEFGFFKSSDEVATA